MSILKKYIKQSQGIKIHLDSKSHILLVIINDYYPINPFDS